MQRLTEFRNSAGVIFNFIRWASAILIVTVSLSALTIATAQGLLAPSSLVASVNGQAITSAELNAAVSSMLRGSMTPADRLQVRSQALNELINQYLIEQQMDRNHQDQHPELLQQFEQLKRQARANFYINSRLQSLPGLHSGAVDRYIRENPSFFAKRRTFHYTEIVLEQGDHVTLSDIKSRSEEAGVGSIVTWLKSRHVHFVLNRLWQSSEQIDPEIFIRLQKMRDGEVTVAKLRERPVIVVLQLDASYPDPVDADAARLSVEIGLQLSARNRAAKMIMAELRSTADLRLFDAVLTVPEVEVREKKAVASRRFVWVQLYAVWLFSLLALVPAALVAYFRKIAEIEWDFENRSQFAYITRRMIIPVIFSGIMGVLLLMPVYDLLTEQFPQRDPVLLIMQAFIGIGLGGAISALSCKVSALRTLFRHRWSAIFTLTFIQCSWLVFSAFSD